MTLGLAVLLGAGTGAAAGELASPGCLWGGGAAQVASVDEALDLHLADGRTAHLAGIAAARGHTGEARNALEAWLVHAAVLVRPLRGEPDRWGRTAAAVFAETGGGSARMVSASEALLEAGLVMARPDADVEACWPTYLDLERQARRAARGLWAGTHPLDPGDLVGLQAGLGSLAIVQGRLAAVHAGRARLYLRFERDGGTGFAAAVALPLVRRLVKAGTDPAAWVGRQLAVRGLLDDRWGWQIDVSSNQQLQLDPP